MPFLHSPNKNNIVRKHDNISYIHHGITFKLNFKSLWDFFEKILTFYYAIV